MSGREDFSFIGRISKAKKKLVFGRGMSVNVFFTEVGQLSGEVLSEGLHAEAVKCNSRQMFYQHPCIVNTHGMVIANNT